VPLAKYGMKDVDAIWYRSHISIPPGRRNLSLAFWGFQGSAQVYANGVLLGSQGPLKDGGEIIDTARSVYSIPDAVVGSGDITIAIRARVGNVLKFAEPFGQKAWISLGSTNELTAYPPPTYILQIEFVRSIAGIRRFGLLKVYYGIVGTLLGLWSLLYFYEAALHPSMQLLNVIGILVRAIYLPTQILLPLFAFWIGWRHKNRDALLLGIPLLINALLSYYDALMFFLNLLGFHVTTDTGVAPISGLRVGWDEVVTLAFSLSLLLFLIIRTVRIARARAEAASEIKAAQTMQQLLLARASLILGALNRESSRQPAEILHNLNRTLLSQGEPGFTTACCVRVEADGAMLFANAGHLNPYLDGRELESPGALPLGLNSGQSYETVHAHLVPGQHLVLVSDGVPEATAKNGTLFGFEKLVELTRLPAAAIADAAQSYGQNDDITVLSLALA